VIQLWFWMRCTSCWWCQLQHLAKVVLQKVLSYGCGHVSSQTREFLMLSGTCCNSVLWLKPGTHQRQSTVSFVADLSSILLTLLLICRMFVESQLSRARSTLSIVLRSIVAKVEHVQLGQLCRKWVIFVAQMSNILSALSPVCTGPKRHGRLCRLSTESTVSNSTLSPVCTGLKTVRWYCRGYTVAASDSVDVYICRGYSVATATQWLPLLTVSCYSGVVEVSRQLAVMTTCHRQSTQMSWLLSPTLPGISTSVVHHS